jgi:hypothetical protein
MEKFGVVFRGVICLRNYLSIKISGVSREFITLQNVEVCDFLELISSGNLLHGVG